MEKHSSLFLQSISAIANSFKTVEAKVNNMIFKHWKNTLAYFSVASMLTIISFFSGLSGFWTEAQNKESQN